MKSIKISYYWWVFGKFWHFLRDQPGPQGPEDSGHQCILEETWTMMRILYHFLTSFSREKNLLRRTGDRGVKPLYQLCLLKWSLVDIHFPPKKHLLLIPSLSENGFWGMSMESPLNACHSWQVLSERWECPERFFWQPAISGRKVRMNRGDPTEIGSKINEYQRNVERWCFWITQGCKAESVPQSSCNPLR